MTALILFAFFAANAPQSGASTLDAFGLGAWQLDRGSAIASTALPSSGTFLLDAAALVPTAATIAPVEAAIPVGSRLRKLLADFSLTLQNIRYRRGGRDPSTGFDCSGFVRYVFRHSVGTDLPADSASQFLAGSKVDRSDMKAGDLVFFRIRGKRISHVGIYLGEGRFIHSPSSGKAVSISRLDEVYWAKRFAGAKRPNALT